MRKHVYPWYDSHSPLSSFPMFRSLSFFLAGTIALAVPIVTFAGGGSSSAPSTGTVTPQDILNVVSPDATPVPPPAAVDGRGGGGGGPTSSIYYPGSTGGVQVQADVTKSVTPDFVAINAYCETGKMTTRQAVRDALQQLYTDIKNNVGKDGRVRKTGAVSAYPYYDQTGADTDSFNGSVNIFIRIQNKNKAQDISDYIEQKNCTVNWDIRLVKTQDFELSILNELATQLNARKAVFEKLLNKRLTLISGATLSTYVDGYGTYDPDTDTVDATTTLTVTFDLGGRATLPTPTPVPLNSSSQPKG